LSKNQTFSQIVGLCLEICWFCTGHLQVVKKSNLYACYTLSDNYYKFLYKLVSDWNALLVAAHHSHARMHSRAVHHTQKPTTIICSMLQEQENNQGQGVHCKISSLLPGTNKILIVLVEAGGN
jgi:hypothetical protein